MDKVKVKFIGKDDPLALRHGKVYDAIIGQKGWYGIVDETKEEYAYPPELFEVITKTMIRVKYTGVDNPIALRTGKIYDAFIGSTGWYGVIDESGEEYGYPPVHFEVVESQQADKIDFIPFMCPLLKREIDFGYCTEIEYMATGMVGPDFLVDGDNIDQETAAKYCVGCKAEKNTNVKLIK